MSLTAVPDFARPERRAEIEACANEVRALAARCYDLLPLYRDAEDMTPLADAQRDLAIKQSQLSMLMVQMGMEAVLDSLHQPKKETPVRRNWLRRLFRNKAPSAPLSSGNGL